MRFGIGQRAVRTLVIAGLGVGLTVGVAALSALPVAAADTGFVSGLNDIPLMPGLSPLGETLVFDKPVGRIAEAVFTGPVDGDTVRRFYRETLPQLGWTADSRGDRFIRDREEIVLQLSGSGNTTVRLVIEPHR